MQRLLSTTVASPRSPERSPASQARPRSTSASAYLPRDVAFAKLEAMVEDAAIVRRELAGGGED